MVRAKADSGTNNKASEMIQESPRSMEPNEYTSDEAKLARLREQLAIGTHQLDNGDGIAIESRAGLDVFFEDLKVSAA